jgi:hypothetical protein
MRWDRHTLIAFGGIAALVIGGALLLEDAGAVFVPVIGMVGRHRRHGACQSRAAQAENGRAGAAAAQREAAVAIA